MCIRDRVWTASWEKEKALKEICCDLLGLCRNKDDVPYNGILRFLGIQKTNMLGSTDSLIYSDDDPYPDDRMKKIYKMYEDYKKDKSYIEFDDFLNMANQCFDKFPDILKFYQDVYKRQVLGGGQRTECKKHTRTEVRAVWAIALSVSII